MEMARPCRRAWRCGIGIRDSAVLIPTACTRTPEGQRRESGSCDLAEHRETVCDFCAAYAPIESVGCHPRNDRVLEPPLSQIVKRRQQQEFPDSVPSALGEDPFR